MIRHARSASALRPLMALVLALLLPVPAVLAQTPTTTAAKSKTVPTKKPAVKTTAGKTVAATTAPTKTTVAKTTATKTTAAKTVPSTATPTAKTAAGKTAAATTPGASAKPVLVASYGDWGAYAAEAGKSKTCYALAQPKDRQPAGLKRDPSYIFISTRPAEGVRNEVSFVMGFDIKTTPGKDPKAQVGSTSIDMVAEGTNLWVKNAAQESQLVDLMKKNQQLVVSAASLKGNVTTDTYSLAGLVQAIDRVQKECP